MVVKGFLLKTLLHVLEENRSKIQNERNILFLHYVLHVSLLIVRNYFMAFNSTTCFLPKEHLIYFFYVLLADIAINYPLYFYAKKLNNFT